MYDVIIVGGGAGAKLVRPLADAGMRVAIVEQKSLGGTCLNRGCIPSKMLIHPMHLFQGCKEMSKFYGKSSLIKFNFKRFITSIQRIIKQESSDIEVVYKKKKNITYINDHVTFIDKHTLLCKKSRKKIEGKTIVVAVGARPFIPGIAGLEEGKYWTSTELLKNSTLPKSLIVIGGGVIAAELGGVYAQYGVKTTFLTIEECMLQNLDKQITQSFNTVFQGQKNIKHIGNIKKISVAHGKKETRVDYETVEGQKNTVSGECLLVATGVIPNTDSLHCEQAGIQLTSRGFIEVNEKMQTTQKHIYALGDCVGKYFYRHAANYQAEYILKRILNNHKKSIRYEYMPYGIFTYPEIAGCGMSEDEAKKQYKKDVIAVSVPYTQSAQGMARRPPKEFFVKLIVQKSSKKILGAHIVGTEASSMIHVILPFIALGKTVVDLKDMIYIHPALPEIVRNAARKAVEKLAL